MSILFQKHRSAYFNNLIGTTTPLLNCNYVSFISYAKELKDTDDLSTIPYEIDRKSITPSNMSFVFNLFSFDFQIGTSQCVCPTSIITAKSVDSRTITLTTSTSSGFAIDNLIDIQTSEGFIESKIIAKTGDNITIDNPRNATIGGLVRKKVSHIIILCNATATRNINDQVFLSFNNSFYKDSTATLTKKLQFDFNI